MKKVIAIFALAALVACGGATSNVTNDTTSAVVSTDTITVKQDTNYYKELNKKRLKELADTAANIK